MRIQDTKSFTRIPLKSPLNQIFAIALFILTSLMGFDGSVLAYPPAHGDFTRFDLFGLTVQDFLFQPLKSNGDILQGEYQACQAIRAKLGAEEDCSNNTREYCVRAGGNNYYLSHYDTEMEYASWEIALLGKSEVCEKTLNYKGPVFKTFDLSQDILKNPSVNFPSIQLGRTTSKAILDILGPPTFLEAKDEGKGKKEGQKELIYHYILKRDRLKEKNCGSGHHYEMGFSLRFNLKRTLQSIQFYDFIKGTC